MVLSRTDNGPQVLETEAIVHYNCEDDDDDDDSGLLITRQEEDCETLEMTKDEIDHLKSQNDNGTTDPYSFNEHMTDQQQNTDETNTQNDGTESGVKNDQNQYTSINFQKERVEAEIETVTMNKRKSSDQHQMNQRKNKRAKKVSSNEDINMDVSYAHNEQIETVGNKLSGTDEIQEVQGNKENVESTEVFKSPLPDAVKPSKGRRGRKRTKVDKKCAEMTTPVGSSSKLIQLVTPTVSHNMNIGHNYTTPQMDEVLQQITLEAASKAPQKKRESAPNATDLEKLRALTAGRRVTRSLIAAKEAIEKKSKEEEDSGADIGGIDINAEHTYEVENACDLMDPSGDARSANRPIKNDRKDSHKPEFTGVVMRTDNKDNQNPNETRTEQDSTDITPDISDNLTRASVDKTVGNLRKSTKQDSPYFRIANAGVFYHRSTDQQADDSFRSVSEDGISSSQSTDTSSSPVTTLGQTTNPVLEKALRNLRCTGSDSPKLLIEKMDTRASPGLLSPALSGVSEV